MMHLLACLWMLIGYQLGTSSWIGAHSMLSAPPADVYIASLYWVVTTLTTVGYGDITGATYQEQLFTMAVEFIGIAFFALIMGSINKTLGQESGMLDIIEDRLQAVDLWLLKLDSTRKEKWLPRPIYEKIKEFINSSLRHDFDMLVDGFAFFDQLKPSLRFRVVEEVFEEFRDRFAYCFGDADGFRASKEFVSYFVCSLYCRIYVPNQVIVRRGDKFPELYLIETGHVVLSLRRKQEHEFFRLPALTYFGDCQIVLGYRAKECYASGSKETRMMCVSRKKLLALLEQFPQVKSYYTQRAR